MTLSETYISIKQALANNLATKGVTGYSKNDGMTTLIDAVLDIQTGSGGSSGCPNVLQGTFTTGSSGNTTGSVSLSYSGTGYPVMVMIVIDGGMYNDTSSGNTDWYNSKNRYDVGFYAMSKARMTSAPSYGTSGADNYGVVDIVYKNSTSNATSYTRTGGTTINAYSSSNAQASTSCIRFKGNAKTMSYYIGNRGSSSIGLARSTTYKYVVVYSS